MVPRYASDGKQKSTEACDDELTLSLGSICSYPTAAGGRRAVLPDDCLPVTPALPVSLRPVNAARALSAATADTLSPPPPTSTLGPVVHGDGDGGVLTANEVAPSLSFTSLSKDASAPPKKCPRVTKLSSASTALDHATSNSQTLPPADSGKDLRGTNGAFTEGLPFPWVKNRVAVHYSLHELSERRIDTIEGEVLCKRCDVRKMIVLDIKAKFKELYDFIMNNIQTMNDRAPAEWKDPTLPDCDKCGQKNSLRPVIPVEKEKINWLFLLLGQTLGLCTLEQLKYFCAHTNQHRTGAKDRVLYSTYMELCNQLHPGGPFDMAFERKNRSRPFV